MNTKTKNAIADLIKNKISEKLINYTSETTSTPFFRQYLIKRPY